MITYNILILLYFTRLKVFEAHISYHIIFALAIAASSPNLRPDAMRMIFLDAAGLSSAVEEPFIVVAGVIIHPDLQWKAIRAHLSDLAEAFIPREHRDGFVFHSTDLFSGNGIFKDREKFTPELRWQILDELAAVPHRFDLPIVWGTVPRRELEAPGRLPAPSGLSPVVHGQMIAFTVAAAAAERWMQEVADPEEVAQMIMEDDHQSRGFLKITQRYLSDPQYYQRFRAEHDAFKLSRIIYPIHFEQKTDSSALQIADLCAFALKRWRMKKPHADRLYKALEPNLVHRLREDHTF
jgi:hypothetical protein